MKEQYRKRIFVERIYREKEYEIEEYYEREYLVMNTIFDDDITWKLLLANFKKRDLEKGNIKIRQY